jgi:hypothetical protein
LSGFITHGDPHSGNFLIGLHPVPSFSWLVALDWGNVIDLTPETRRLLHSCKKKFISLPKCALICRRCLPFHTIHTCFLSFLPFVVGIGVLAEDPSLILDSLGRTEKNKQEIQWIQLKSLVRGVFQRVNKLRSDRLQYRRSRSTTPLRNLHSRFNTVDRRDVNGNTDNDGTRAQEENGSFRPRAAGSEDAYGDTIDDESMALITADLNSEEFREKLRRKKSWSLFSRQLVKLETILADAILRGAEIPEGTVSFFRAHRFLVKTLETLSIHPAVRGAGCKIPDPAWIYFQGLLGGLSRQNVPDACSAVKHFFHSAGRNAKRAIRRLRRGVDLSGLCGIPETDSTMSNQSGSNTPVERRREPVEEIYPPKLDVSGDSEHGKASEEIDVERDALVDPDLPESSRQAEERGEFE